MPGRTLRSIYTRLARAHTLLATRPGQRASPPIRATLADIACWVVPLVGLSSTDTAFSSRDRDLLPRLNPRLPDAPLIPDGVGRLHAAIGAATLASRLPSHPIVVAFFERHETEKAAWINALALATELPLLLIVLPRWKGREDAIDLGKLSRAAKIPAIPVDSQDPIALYRVAQESILRARTGGGAALLEAINLPTEESAMQKLAAFLLHRGLVSETWIKGVERSQSEVTLPVSTKRRND